MKTDLVDWKIERADSGGAWHAAAPGLGVSLEGDGGLVDLLCHSGLLAAEGVPAGAQEPFSLCMDRAEHRLVRPGPEPVRQSFVDALEAVADLKVITNTERATIAQIKEKAQISVAACEALSAAVSEALTAVSAMPEQEMRPSFLAMLLRTNKHAEEILGFTVDVISRTDGVPDDTGITPWREISAAGDKLVGRLMKAKHEVAGVTYQYEERWLRARLDDVHVYVIVRDGRVHVMISKQNLKPQHHAARPAAVA